MCVGLLFFFGGGGGGGGGPDQCCKTGPPDFDAHAALYNSLFACFGQLPSLPDVSNKYLYPDKTCSAEPPPKKSTLIVQRSAKESERYIVRVGCLFPYKRPTVMCLPQRKQNSCSNLLVHYCGLLFCDQLSLNLDSLKMKVVNRCRHGIS